MALSAAALKVVLAGLKVAPSVYSRLQAWRGKPTDDERKLLVRYARRLNERRVFSAPFNVEVVESCVASLSTTAEFTDETLAALDHPGARAVVASVLDLVRRFLDRWGSYSTPRHRWLDPFGQRDLDEFPEFFKDLGELRGNVRLLVAILAEFEPGAIAPNITEVSPAGGG